MALSWPLIEEIPVRTRVGRIHSVESCGAVDGPGLRYVVFTQGCQMRCRFCHNPDTWGRQGGQEATVGSLVDEIRAYLPFMKASGGGVTVSGGEPLMQPGFVAGIFAECRKLGIHTALDTSGYVDAEQALPVLEHTDLVLLDLKQLNPEGHKSLTGVANDRVLRFARLLAAMNKPMWIRYVVVPGHNDSPEDVQALADFVLTLSSVQKVELLPYHELGKHKWAALGIPYTLNGVEPPSKETIDRVKQQLTSRGIQVAV